MPKISDVSIINWNKTEAKPVASGLERTICSQALCGSKYLDRLSADGAGRTATRRAGRRRLDLVYVIEAKGGTISFNGKSHAAEDGVVCSGRQVNRRESKPTARRSSCCTW